MPRLTDTALLAVLIAAAGGLVAGRAFAHARHRGLRDRPGFRTSPHYSQGLYYLASGQIPLARSELAKVAREDPEAADVQQVLSHLYRETGQVERAIQIHQALLARRDLTRAERAHTLASLGTDFRKAGFLDRAEVTFAEALDVDPNNLYALEGLRKVNEDHQQWQRAYEVQIRLVRLRKADDALVLGHLQARIGEEAARAGEPRGGRGGVPHGARPRRPGPAGSAGPGRPVRSDRTGQSGGRTRGSGAHHPRTRLPRLRTPGDPLRGHGRALAFRGDVRTRHSRGLARLAGPMGAVAASPGRGQRRTRPWASCSARWRPTHRGLPSTSSCCGPCAPSATSGRGWTRISRRQSARSSTSTPTSVFPAGTAPTGMLWRCPHCHEWNTFVEERLGPTTIGT